MKLINQKRKGLFAEHRGFAPITYTVRATVPALEALAAAGAKIEDAGHSVYRIILGNTMPANIIACHVNGPPYVDACLRTTNEPEYPMEFFDKWKQADWTPCPVCGAPVVWYEAGYAPGYRICTNPPYHHSMVK